MILTHTSDGIPPTLFTAVFFYTNDAVYAREAKRLVKTLDRNEVAYRGYCVERSTSWARTTSLKAGWIEEARNQVPGPLLYLDADAYVWRDPSTYLSRIKSDVAAVVLPNGNLLSGTIFFADSLGARSFIRSWRRLCDFESSKAMGLGSDLEFERTDQFLMSELIAEERRLPAPSFSFESLPLGFTHIRDGHRLLGLREEIFIEHLQASRESKPFTRSWFRRRTRLFQLRWWSHFSSYFGAKLAGFLNIQDGTKTGRPDWAVFSLLKLRTRHCALARQIGRLSAGIGLKLHNFSRSLVRDYPLPKNSRLTLEDDLLIVEFPERQVAFPHFNRLQTFSDGFEERQKEFLSSYCLDREVLQNLVTVVDVGANIGELGMALAAPAINYVALEPDPLTYRALSRNLPKAKAFAKAASNENQSKTFFSKPASADSSLYPPSGSLGAEIQVETVRLDDFIPGVIGSREIDLLKIEVEGFEPEVLEGSQQILKITKYCAIDAGPERAGETTLPGCLRILNQSGFRMAVANLARGRFLFVNSNLGE